MDAETTVTEPLMSTNDTKDVITSDVQIIDKEKISVNDEDSTITNDSDNKILDKILCHWWWLRRAVYSDW